MLNAWISSSSSLSAPFTSLCLCSARLPANCSETTSPTSKEAPQPPLVSKTSSSLACRASLSFSSTCATYGEPVRVPIAEDHPQNPISPYGRTKLHMEHMMQDYATAYGLQYAALRYFNAAGAAQDGSLGEDHQPETHLIPLVLQVALGQRESIKMFGGDWDTPDGTCVRDYIHVDDLADAHLRALARLQTGGESIQCNLGTGHGYSVKEVIEVAREVTGHAIPAEVVGRRPGDPAELMSGGTAARDLLGWESRRAALEQIIRDAWAFHSTHPDGYPS